MSCDVWVAGPDGSGPDFADREKVIAESIRDPGCFRLRRTEHSVHPSSTYSCPGVSAAAERRSNCSAQQDPKIHFPLCSSDSCLFRARFVKVRATGMNEEHASSRQCLFTAGSGSI